MTMEQNGLSGEMKMVALPINNDDHVVAYCRLGEVEQCSHLQAESSDATCALGGVGNCVRKLQIIELMMSDDEQVR